MSRLVRANVNDYSIRPKILQKMIDQIIRDMQSTLADARKQVAAMIAQGKGSWNTTATKRKSWPTPWVTKPPGRRKRQSQRTILPARRCAGKGLRGQCRSLRPANHIAPKKMQLPS